MSEHALDRPVWNSLISRHASFAEGNEKALRFLHDVSPFASPREDTPECFEALTEIIAPGEAAVMLQVPDFDLPPQFEILESGLGVQLTPDDISVCETIDASGLTPLGDADGEEMLALARLTKPGPFTARTHRLGAFWGVKREGRLVAMAGERFKQPGYAEISGVCTHPDFRGHGFARTLSAAVARQIVSRGEAPYLHAYADNEGAVKLYESLGFRIRAHVHAVFFKRAGEPLRESFIGH